MVRSLYPAPLLAVLAASLPVFAAPALELRLAVDQTRLPDAKKRRVDGKVLAAALAKRLPILSKEPGTVEFKAPDDIRVRLPGEAPGEIALQAFTRRAQLEFRDLDDVQSSFNPKGRYVIDFLTVQDQTSLRFRDRRTNRLVPTDRLLERCPLLASTADLVPDSTQPLGGGAILGVRVHFTDAAARRLTRFASRPGRLLVATLDGEIVAINGTAPQTGGKKRREPVPKVEEMDIVAKVRSVEEAGYLAAALNAGALPYPVVVVSRGAVAE
jgi:preprotein translocase subunit SecD